MKQHLRTFAAVLVTTIGLCGTAPAAPHQMPTRPDIAYGSDPAQLIDLYQPAAPGPHPLVVFLHGGGWRAGSKVVGNRVAPSLTGAGYALASIEYRKVPATDPAGTMADIARAIAFLLTNARSFDIDPRRFAVMGHSAGSHMAALLATDPGYLRAAGVDPSRLAAVVTLDGVFDVGMSLTHYPREDRFEAFGHDPAVWRHYSPAALVAGSGMRPRFCVMREDTNPRYIEQAQAFEAALRQAGATVETGIANGYGHGPLIQMYERPDAPMAPFVLRCLTPALPPH